MKRPSFYLDSIQKDYNSFQNSQALINFNFQYVFIEFIYIEIMGSCASGKSNPKTNNQIATPSRISFAIVVNKEQIYLLKLIFQDLARRIVDRKINLENFRLFFQKNGLWGQRLFNQFDSDASDLISQQQFLNGIARIFKATQKEKIKLLFKFFARNSQKSREGIQFRQFITMLYNYPKEDLKAIMNDSDFFNTQLKNHLTALGQNHRMESIFKANSNTNKPIVFVFKDTENSEQCPTVFGKQIMKNLQQQKSGTGLKMKYENHQIEVKTANVQNLVKKFARSIFNKYNIDIEKGKLNEENFANWIVDHKNLYNNYYSGFHNDIWQFDNITHRLKFYQAKRQKESKARMKTGSGFKDVKIILAHQLLVICQQKTEQTPIEIICLQGLAVKKKFQSDQSFGIQISHRDGVYQVKQFIFKNEQLMNEWMQHLKSYKGDTVEQLYHFGDKIGTGKFSVVYSCVQNVTKQKYAIKVIESYKLDQEARQLIAHESSIMNLLNYPFLVQYHETIKTKTHIYIITELVQGKDLFQYVKDTRGLDEKEAARIAYQTIMGVKYLHQLGIVHRDMKPENIMVNLDEKGNIVGSVKIIDFGFANYLTKYQEMKTQEKLAGTPNYIAPQVLKNQAVSQKIDNFAIGSIIYYMVSCKVPFNGFDMAQILQRTMDGAYEFQDKSWKKISWQCKDLIAKLLQTNPNDRITLQQALQHPWFSRYYTSKNELDQVIERTPSKSYTSVQNVVVAMK